MSQPKAATIRDQRARFGFALNLPGGLLVCTVVLIALGLLLLLSVRGNDGSILGSGFTFSNFVTALGEPLYAAIILRSVLIAGLVTAVTLLAAYPVAYYLAFHAGKRRDLILFLVTLPFWTSYLLRVFAWKIALAYNGVVNTALTGLGVVDEPIRMLDTLFAVVLTLAHAYAAFAVLPIYVALETIPKSLFEAASDLGATPGQTFRRVVLPMSMPGVLAAALCVFVPTLGDYVTPALVGGPSSIMIGSMIQAQFGKANDWPFGAALSVVTILVVIAVILVVRRLDRSEQAAS